MQSGVQWGHSPPAVCSGVKTGQWDAMGSRVWSSSKFVRLDMSNTLCPQPVVSSPVQVWTREKGGWGVDRQRWRVLQTERKIDEKIDRQIDG